MKWIKIEDEKPQCAIDIFFVEDGKVHVGWLETYEPLEDLAFYDPLKRKTYYEVTHWMGLPKPPEK